MIPIYLDKLAPNEVISFDFGVYGGLNILFPKDHYSGFNCFWLCKQQSTQEVITHLKSHMNLFGLPHQVVHDRGPYFRASFVEFLESLHISNPTQEATDPLQTGLPQRCLEKGGGTYILGDNRMAGICYQQPHNSGTGQCFSEVSWAFTQVFTSE